MVGEKMKKKALIKEFIMELKKSRSRFISILLIVALGVAFFAGIRATEPDMRLSADKYYDDNNLLDIRVISSLGLTEKDLDYVKSVEGVKEAEVVHSFDALLKGDESDYVVKLYSLTDSMNQMNLIEGRMPTKSGEVALDAQLTLATDIQIGDRITLASGTDEVIEESLKVKDFTVVGIGNSSNYLSHSRGTSTIGNGKLKGFLVLSKEDFILEAYSEIYVSVEGAKEAVSYEDDYVDMVNKVKDRIEDKSINRIEERYLEVILEPSQELIDGEKELEEKEAEVIEELADVKKQLEEARIELEDGRNKIKDSKIQLQEGKESIESAYAEYYEGKKQLEEAAEKLQNGMLEIQKGESEISKAKLEIETNNTLLVDGKNKLKDGMLQVETGLLEVDTGIELLRNNIEELSLQKEALEPYKELKVEDYTTIVTNITQLEGQLEQLIVTKNNLTVEKVNLELNLESIEEQEGQLLEAKEQIEEKENLLLENRTKLEEQISLLADKEEELNSGFHTLKREETKLLEGEIELAENEVKIADGLKELEEKEQEYLDGEVEAKEEIEKAKREIMDGKEKLAKIDKPTWYVLDRNSIQTYVEYGQDAERIANLGKVFPVIFFLVAALVSLTTMTRMVEEQRTQIGTLKSLGYSKLDIANKYIYYGLLATLSGSIVGVLIGQKILPMIIITAYKIMYVSLPKAITPYNIPFALLSTLIAVICITGTTMIACYKELELVPASLMRPAAPKEGKRVIVERIPFIWKRLNFTSKSTIRNLLRYKKRFFMTIFGIGACLALLVVGYGIKDSISAMVDIQYGELWHQDASITLNVKEEEEKLEEVYQYLELDSSVEDYSSFYEFSTELTHGDSRMANLIVAKDLDTLSELITFRDRKSGKKVSLTEQGILLSEKVANVLEIKTGDSVQLTLKDDKKVDVYVVGIVENYLQHYVFMTSSLYESLMEEEIEYNTLYLKYSASDTASEDDKSKELLRLEGVNTVMFTTALKKQIHDMLESLNIVIYVLILAAGLLAFVVLYNLNNININERKRELATLKVLGFTDMEVAAYVYRENTILTLIGSVVGVFLGIILHRFVILTTEIESMMFGREILLPSFIYSILFTFAFSIIVNVAMYYQLRKINMVESLKSVE